tara:strand:+ start:90611 stop:90994 length:384 start_codon:yes stop_codon:yes gene_type:complete
LHTLPDDRARLVFEMENVAGLTIQRMSTAASSPGHKDTLFIHLEDLMTDTRMERFEQMFSHFGVSPAYMPLALAVAFKNSVFNPQMKRSKHITSGRSELWRSVFNDDLCARFREYHPDVVEKLGYSW